MKCQPLNRENIERLAKAGVDRLGSRWMRRLSRFSPAKGKDAGGRYSWKGQFPFAGGCSGGFRERQREHARDRGARARLKGRRVGVIQRCVDMGVLPALFAFTPVRGTSAGGECASSSGCLQAYAAWPVPDRDGLARAERHAALTVKAESRFRLAECRLRVGRWQRASPSVRQAARDCNRPFYNEKPGGPLYNYPNKSTLKEFEEIKGSSGAQLKLSVGLRTGGVSSRLWEAWAFAVSLAQPAARTPPS